MPTSHRLPAAMAPCLAPIVLFVYKRLEETRTTLEALRANHLAPESDLIVYSDAARSPQDEEAVAQVRTLIEQLGGFRSVTLVRRPVNMGLANSVITGVTEVLERHGRAIVLEDDLITSRNFLDFMNQALEHHASMPEVFAVSAYTYPLCTSRFLSQDALYGHRAVSWGWATWKDRWDLVDWDVKDYRNFLEDAEEQAELRRGGSDLPDMLARQQAGLIDSWMVRWVYAQRKLRKLDVFPKVSKVLNNGFGAEATHTRGVARRFRTRLDRGDQRLFRFAPAPAPSALASLEVGWKWSTPRRLCYKLLALASNPSQRTQLLGEIRFWLGRRLGNRPTRQ